MRLSDESISKEREDRMRAYRAKVESGPEVLTVSKELMLSMHDQLAALIAEVRALRECEQFAENMAEHDCAYGDNCPTFGSRHGRCTGCAARAALAAVHALEDKP